MVGGYDACYEVRYAVTVFEDQIVLRLELNERYE